MPSLLLEFFSEEIPARMQTLAAEHLERAFSESMKEAGLAFAALKLFVTPRRLALMCDGIPAAQPDVTAEKKGPKTNAPQGALDGFLRATGLPLAKLEKRMVGKDETYFAVIHQQGRAAAEVLKEIIEKILSDFPWPKSMRWGSRDVRWVRPLHSILCIFDGQVIPAEFGDITAGNVTYGHRFLAPQAITINASSEYVARLKEAKVLADAAERKAHILSAAKALAAKHGLTLKRDDGLLAEVTGLVEWPVLLVGQIDAKFMDLPPEVLVSEMRAHQKYFALLTKEGAMSDRFLITSNMVTSDEGKAVIAGNERVLRARLSDGRFFWDQDRRKPLSDWAQGLEGVTFHAKVGTIAQKVERVKALARKLAEHVPGADPKLVERAATLCKADLTTGMVGEFPELQGVMGRYYALAQLEDPAVADAIRDHYLPLGPDSPVPAKPVSICVALADKLDTLISMFASGEKPTGSKDPFALRRGALGVIRIILENNVRLHLRVVLNPEKYLKKEAAASLQGDVLTEELLTFFSDRLKVQLKDQGIRHDLINAVMANGDDDLQRVVMRAKALQQFLSTDDGANLLAGYKRATNILSIEEKKDKQEYRQVDEKLFALEEEKNLNRAFADIKKPLQEKLAAEDFIAAMQELTRLRAPIDGFFEKVMVNCEDKNLRASRLGLLNAIRETMNEIANFALIEG